MRSIARQAVPFFLVIGLIGVGCSSLAHGEPDGELQRLERDFFETRIRPVLVERCYSCHSEEAAREKNLQAGLRVDSRDGLRKGGVGGPAVVPGKPAESLLVKAIHHEGDLQMPPDEKLSDAIVADFEAWIARGAFDPRDAAPLAQTSPRDHWAFQPLAAGPPPSHADPVGAAWVRTPVDAFVLRDLRSKGLEPNPRADGGVLVRRLSFDLLGLPPTTGDLDAFADASDAEFDRLADDWLTHIAHGERWAQHWLDVARYADSAGYSVDDERPTMFHYRDFVIRALVADMPFDEFIRLQLAGDLISADRVHSATGFCTCGPFNTNRPKEIDRYDELDDMITTTGQAFLGLNLGCARCHNHKYDPIPQADYFRMLAVFSSSSRTDAPFCSAEERAAIEKSRREKVEKLDVSAGDRTILLELLGRAPDPKNEHEVALQKQHKDLLAPAKVPHAHVLKERHDVPVGRSFLLERGNPERKTTELTASFLGVLMQQNSTADRWLEGGKKHPRRALADWLVDVDHGAGRLTARVIVNRLWHHHFGQGLVRTPNDFGIQGEPPTHPELLDWLASELIREGWRLRPIHQLILRSSTYRQASTFDPRRAAVDPESKLLWRYTPRRLDAEAYRDFILAVSGGLDASSFGPSIHPLIPNEAIIPAARQSWPNTKSDNPATWRRSIYVFVRRSIPFPFFQAFDRPDRTSSVGKRHQTTIVPQALHLVNDPLIRTQSKRFAERVAAEAKDPAAQVRLACRLALGRLPTADEEAMLVRFLTDAGPGRDGKAALADLCQAIFMLNDFVTIE